MNPSAISTAYLDLKGIQRLILNLHDNKEFISAHIFSIFRDLCLIMDEVIDTFFTDSIDIDERVNIIRNRIHLYIKKRGQNQKTFRKILDYHIEAYGDDVNNIGFYLNNKGEVVGSTLYSAYILLGTNNLPFPMVEEEAQIRDKTFSFAKYLGEVSSILSISLENALGLPFSESIIVTKEICKLDSYECRDINHNSLFLSDNDLINTFILRLILSLQEISDVIWLRGRYLANLQNPLYIDWYMLLRLTTLKTDEILDNLLNIKNHSKEQFHTWNNKSNGRVEQLLEKYSYEIKEECSTMRNMIHYDIETEGKDRNFVGYLNKKEKQVPNFLTNTIDVIIDSYLKPLRYEIIQYLEIERIEPLSDWEMIINRLSKLNKTSISKVWER
jgi:hypothetical protein